MTRNLLKVFGLLSLATVTGVGLCLLTAPPPPPVGETHVLHFEGEPTEGIPDPWKVRKTTGVPNFAFPPRGDGNDQKVARITCVSSSFSLNRQLDANLDPAVWRRLWWEWNAEQLPVGADVDPQGKLDKVLQVAVVFAGLNVITYLWDTTAPVGTTTDDRAGPFTVKEYVIEKGRAHVGRWVRADRDVYADYTKLYGTPPGRILAVRLQANSQYTKSTCVGSIGRLTFEKVK